MVYVQHFDSMDAFAKFIGTAKNNAVFSDCKQSARTGISATNFTGTKDFAEAENLFRQGWKSGIKALEKQVAADFAGTANRATVRNYYVGACPNVPRALQGLPDAMRQVYRTPQKQRVLTILIDGGAHCKVRKDRYMQVAACVYQAIREIERQGTRVELIHTHGFEIPKENSSAETLVVVEEVTLKKASEIADAGRLSFAVAHMSMTRRLDFKWLEVCPCSYLNGDMAKNYDSYCYGYSVTIHKDVKALYDAEMKKRHGNYVQLYMQTIVDDSSITSGEQVVELIKSELKWSAKK